MDRSLDQEVNRLQSQLASMSHGYYTPAQWKAFNAELQDALRRAQLRDRLDLSVQLITSRAMVLSQVFGERREAAEILTELLNRHPETEDPAFRRVYVELADILARLGDEAGVRTLIARYRNSNVYDPEPFLFKLDTAEERPVQVVRARSAGNDSVTVTAMENALVRAGQAPGRVAHDFTARTASGRVLHLSDLRGQWVLLDFFHPRWPGQAERLEQLTKVYPQYADRGLVILGIPLRAEWADFASSLSWPVIAEPHPVLKQFRVFGQPDSLLLDPNGRIDMRGVSPAQLQRTLDEWLRPEL